MLMIRSALTLMVAAPDTGAWPTLSPLRGDASTMEIPAQARSARTAAAMLRRAAVGARRSAARLAKMLLKGWKGKINVFCIV